MKRRDLVTGLSGGLVAGAALALSGCTQSECAPTAGGVAASGKTFDWRMYTTWPKNFPGLGTGAEWLAQQITTMSQRRLKVTVYGGGERVPALETFDAVSRGSAQMGHGAAYYWKGKASSAPFFATIPFGMTATELSGWLHFGGGMELYRELYSSFGVIPFEAGNTGVQMGGWFRKPIESVADLKGLKMRIPGVGGEVLAKLGVATVNVPGGELFTALSTGAIDAAEWVGPYNDLAFGLHKAAKVYHYPGWHEPGANLEMIVNKEAWQELPADLQAIVETAALASSHRMMAELKARNGAALKQLVEEHGVDVRPFPPEVLNEFRRASEEVVQEMANKDEFSKRVYASFNSYLQSVKSSTAITDKAYLNAR